MPIPNIAQPETIKISDELILRKFDFQHLEEALLWYQAPELVYLVDGVREPYTMDKLLRMYKYLDAHGELYWITWQGSLIGDVTFWQDDMPIVIGDPTFRGKGIGQQVVKTLTQRGRSLGYDTLHVNEIYKYNQASLHCFLAAGFEIDTESEDGYSLVYHVR